MTSGVVSHDRLSLGQGGQSLSHAAVHGPSRRSLPSAVLFCGAAVLAACLMAVAIGLPQKLWYDADAPGKRNKNTSHDMLMMSRSIEKNIKYIRASSGNQPGQYNAWLTSIDKGEDAIPALNTAINDMGGGVADIDTGLKGVSATTAAMAADMEAMLGVTQNSASTMNSLTGDVDGLAASMSALLAATETLTRSMAGIETKAGKLGSTRTNKALASTRELNDVLPDTVPEASTGVLPTGAAGGGGNAGGATAAPQHDAPPAGAQPAYPRGANLQ